MRKIKTLVIILLLTAAGFYLYQQKKQDPISLSASELAQGDTLLIKMNGSASEEKITGEFGSRKIDFFQQTAILGIDVNERPGEHILIINLPSGKKIEKIINISKTDFPTTELLVTKELRKKGYTPQKIVGNIQGEEGLTLKKIISTYTPKIYFDKAFINPLKEIKIVGAFGIIKKTGSSTIQHLGVDLDAEIGTEVLASNDGKVSFSRELPDYGRTLIIDHGLGIYSLYLHLEEFKTFEGKLVKQGQVIGLSGNSGYSIAPHLHFSIKINNANVDPLKFLETTQSWRNSNILE
ncbi:MAG: M23 family metallopeptidase [Candidatus Nealsonbacteria bacterium]|nr:M23 family metallopeptidase [Candidatus Nealsonbacteria bacterium]